MDRILENSSTESKPKSFRCFTACFGFSNQKLSTDMKLAASNSKNKKTTSWTFLSSFRVNKSTVKSIPAEDAASEKYNRVIHFPKSEKKISQQQNKQAAEVNKTYIPAAGPGQTISKAQNHKNKNSDTDKDIIRENSSNFHQSILLVKEDKRQNRKKENKRTRSSSFGPLQIENTSIVPTKTTRVLPHSMSLPPPNRKKEKAIHGEDNADIVEETQRTVDPIVGMSIMMGTLAIMLVWGKLCAILCTCAWLYMVPRLRTVVDNTGNGSNSGSLDMESSEYKKKVVLEGLLQRDRRRVIGNL